MSIEDVTAGFSNLENTVLLFLKLEKGETIAKIHEDLVEKTRVKHGKNEEPTVGIIDTQSVKNTLVSSKNIKGIKRHVIVGTLGLILAVVIKNASVQD